MVKDIDKKLVKLQEDIAKKKRLISLLEELNLQKKDLEDKVRTLDKIRMKEENDVEKIDGLSLQSLYYTVVGKKKEKLSKERKEAYAAVAKYDMAVTQLDRMLDYIDELKGELKELDNCEKEYEEVISEKISIIKEHSEVEAIKVKEYEYRIVEVEKNITEINEAMDVCNKAIDKAKRVVKCLDAAIEYSQMDMSSPKLEYSVLKHDELDNAHKLIKSLHFSLVKVRTELKDVDIYSISNMNVKINGLLQFADFFLDGLFTDIAIHRHINEVKTEIEDMIQKLIDITEFLKERKNKNENEVISIKNKIDKIVVNY